MTIEEATKILKERTGDWHTQAAAAAYTISFYNEHSDRLRPFEPKRMFVTDAIRPQHAAAHRDAAPMTPNWSAARNNPEAGGGRADGGKQPGSRSGARLVQVLDGPVTSYFVAARGDGRACLYQTTDADDALDPHRTATGTRVAATVDRAALQREMRSRDQLRQLEQKSIASGITAFWRDPPTRDQSPPATGIVSAANEAFWSRHSG